MCCPLGAGVIPRAIHQIFAHLDSINSEYRWDDWQRPCIHLQEVVLVLLQPVLVPLLHLRAPQPALRTHNQLTRYVMLFCWLRSVKCSYLELYNEEITDLLAVGADVPKARGCWGQDVLLRRAGGRPRLHSLSPAALGRLPASVLEVTCSRSVVELGGQTHLL